MVGRFTCKKCGQPIRVDYAKAPGGDFRIACPQCHQAYELRRPVEGERLPPPAPVLIKPAKLRDVRCPSCGLSFEFDVLLQDSAHPEATCTHCGYHFSLYPWPRARRWIRLEGAGKPLQKMIIENRYVTGLFAILMAYVYGVRYAVEDYSRFLDGVVFVFFTLGVYWMLGIGKLPLSQKFFAGYSSLFVVVWVFRLLGYSRLASPILEHVSELYMLGFAFFSLLELLHHSVGFIPARWYRRLSQLSGWVIVLANLLLCAGLILWKMP